MAKKISLERCDWMENWYRLEPDSGPSVEGDRAQWREVLQNMQRGVNTRHKRCASKKIHCGWEFWSPRNSCGPDDHQLLMEEEVAEFIQLAFFALDQQTEAEKVADANATIARLEARVAELEAALREAADACGKANACASLPDHTRDLCLNARICAAAALAPKPASDNDRAAGKVQP